MTAALPLAAAPSRDRRGVWVLPPLVVIGALFFYPLALILAQALTPATPGAGLLDNFLRIGATPLFRSAVLHTFEIAAASTLGCLVLGFVLALVIAFVPFPGARPVARLIETFIALPTFLLTLAFSFVYGSAGILNVALVDLLGLREPPIAFLYTQWGVILAEITAYTPFVLRPLLAAFSQVDPAQVEVAASLGARPGRIVREILLPAALPAALVGGVLCLLLTVNEFGIVLFIGAKGVITLPLLVYGKAIQEGDYTAACTIAVVDVALSLALYWAYRATAARLGGDRAGMV